jgi:hypothetical protein
VSDRGLRLGTRLPYTALAMNDFGRPTAPWTNRIEIPMLNGRALTIHEECNSLRLTEWGPRSEGGLIQPHAGAVCSVDR